MLDSHFRGNDSRKNCAVFQRLPANYDVALCCPKTRTVFYGMVLAVVLAVGYFEVSVILICRMVADSSGESFFEECRLPLSYTCVLIKDVVRGALRSDYSTPCIHTMRKSKSWERGR